MTGGFAALLVILVLTFVASVHGAARLADLDAAIGHARDVLEEIIATRGVWRGVESARRGYLITNDAEFLDLYLGGMKDAVAHLDRLRALTDDDPAQRRVVDAIGPLVARQLTAVTDAVTGDRPGTGELGDDGAVVAEQIRGHMVELEDAERARIHDREAEANARTVKVIRGFAGVALVALLLLGAAYYILDRDAAVHAAVLEELRLQRHE